MALYQPEAEISVDERMVKSKARFSFKQYIKNKPTKWGFKLWCLCEAKTGYTINFIVYRGKEGEILSTNGLAYDVVMKLSSPFLDQGYRIYMDNYYTSPTLLKDLFDKNTYATGTMAKNRRGFPKEIKEMMAEYNKKPRGSGIYVRDKEIVYTVWKDTKCVAVGSNQHPGHSEDTVLRNWKENGERKKKDVPIPIPIYNYNKFMGGVDHSDQMIKYYEVLRQTHKYWKTLFFHFIDLSTVNAYLLYKIIHPDTKTSHFQFREKLVQALCQTSFDYPTTPGSGGRPANDITVKHYLTQSNSIRECVYCKVVNKKRSRTSRVCAACELPLCFTGNNNCFVKYHHRSFAHQRSLIEMKYKYKVPRSHQKTTTTQLSGRPEGTFKSKGRGKRKRKNW